MMQAIILCGGRGTRLGNTIGDLPKAMAPVGGRPFLEHVLRRLSVSGFDRVILATGHRHEAIHAHFGSSFADVDLVYSREIELLGTGGSTWQALTHSLSQPCFVLNGDSWAEVDYAAMLNAHVNEAATFTLAAQHVPDVGRYGALTIESGRVVAFREKGDTGPGLINAGVYLAAQGIRDVFPMHRAFSLERDLLAAHLAEINPLAWPTGGKFIDIGIPADLVRAQAMFSSR
jgi:D-glycero-alpha-D-manno-heptose 1-phosphate guanylyltransferase